MKHKRQEECGWVRGMYKPEKEGEYLIKDNNGKAVVRFNGKEWEEKMSNLLCWTFIPETKIEAPF